MMNDSIILYDKLVMCYSDGMPTGLSPYNEWWHTEEAQRKFKDGDKVKLIITKED